MKYIKIIFFICAIFSIFIQNASAQGNKINVKAVVLDTRGIKVPGAIIVTDIDKSSAITNDAGEFSISTPANSILTVSAIGFKPTLVKATADLKKVTIKSVASDLVQVAFNQVDKADLLGGVSSMNVANMLESNYYTYSLDNLGSYLPGYHNNIWGTDSKLVLVDGIPRDEYNVIPAEIEQITILKDAASVALYGSRAADGVVLITTKRGTKGGNQFNVRANTGIMVPKRYPEYMGSAEYMTMYNEALTNDGLATLYTQDQIDKTTSGKYPVRYPDLNYLAPENLKPFTRRNEFTAEYSGGNDRARYYVNIGNYNTTNLINVGKEKNGGENRFNVRANLDIKLSDVITSKINSSVTFYDNKNGNTGSSNGFWANSATFRPNQIAPFIPVSLLQSADAATQALVANTPFLINGNSMLGGTTAYQTNTFADLYTKGYTLATTRKYQFDASLNFNLASVLKGLSFDTQFGIDYNTSYQTTVGDNTYNVYAPTWANDSTITTLTPVGTADAANYSTSLYNSYNRSTMFFSGMLKYNNTFNNVHNVSAMLLAHAYTLQETQVYHAVANANLGLQVSYNYKQKYYADFTGNVVHSSRLAPGYRDAFSPTVSLGWRLSKEDFLSNSTVVNDLKLTASAGILNTDLDFTQGNGYYNYLGIYSDAGDYFSWQEGRQIRSTIVTRGANPSLTFEKKKEVSVGLEASLFNNAVQISGSYFYNLLEGIPIQNGNLYPNFLANGSTNFLPFINYNTDQRNGFDFGINFNKKIQGVDLSIGMVGTYYETTAFKRSESYADAYQNRQGKPLDAIFGLKNLGFFKDAADIAASPTQSWGVVKPGDIKYQDQNNDGIIDSKDEVYLGRGGYYGSPLTLGLNITAKWNGFSIFVLANSGSGSIALKNGSYWWATAGTTAKYSAAMRNRWTVATAETATYPRLTTSAGDNNYRNSDFWLYKNDRINLARVQLSYDLPKKLFAKSFISGLGVYINGNDLLTIAKERDWMETNIGSAPQTRYYTIGLKAAF